MSPTKPGAEVEAQGLKAYEQAGAFERLREWRLPLSYGVLPLIPSVTGLALLHFGHNSSHITAAMVCFGCAVLFSFFGWRHWEGLKARYEKNLKLLAELERLYGDQLSWVKMEKHFAELEALERELEKEKREG